MKSIEQKKGEMLDKDILDNFESALKSAFYMHLRHLYNKHTFYNIESTFTSAIFFFVREYCYASMFRYNQKGGFNVPYGGIQYNRKDLLKKINSIKSIEYRMHLQNTKIYNLDFEDFLNQSDPKIEDLFSRSPI